VFSTLVIGLVGSLFLIDYKRKNIDPTLVLIGFSTLSISFLVGKVVTNNMFAKLIGSSSNRSYFSYSLLIIAMTRSCSAFVNIHLLHIGSSYLFGLNACLYLTALILMTCFIDDLTPHYSYLIEK
jgi:O-antigen ligase